MTTENTEEKAPKAKKTAAKTDAAKPAKKEGGKKKAAKSSLVKQRGKRYASIAEGHDRTKVFAIADAIKYVKERAKSKFDESFEISINLGIDPEDTNNVVRGVVSMPNGTGRNVRVAVFAQGAKAEEAKKAGADIVGAADLAEDIAKGKINFDRCIATPDMMGNVGKVGKILGPKGLMPNPKLGSVTMDVAAAVKAAKSGQVEFRAEKAGIVHAGIGKASFTEKQLLENIKAFVDAVNKAKPGSAKNQYFKKASIASTMGVGVKVDIASILVA